MISYPISKSIPSHYTVKAIVLMIKAIKEYIIKTEKNKKSIILIGTGSSGAILCGIIAWELNKSEGYCVEITYIDKKNTKSHFPHKVLQLKNINDNSTLIFIDDFIASGNTLLYVLIELEKEKIQLNAICTSDNTYMSTIKDILKENNITDISI